MNQIRKIALIQSTPGKSPQENLENEIKMIRQAAQAGADIVCTKELFLSEYFCQSQDAAFFDMAQPIPGPLSQTFSELANELSIVIIASVFERSLAGLYHNCVIVIDSDGELAGKYRKAHIPDDPQYFEKYYFTPGQSNACVFQTSKGRIGVLICWDQWFPEAARMAALQGAQILFYPTAIGWHADEKAALGDKQKDAWLTIQRSHAIANSIPVCAVNRIGTEGMLEFWGSSFVSDCFGEIVALAGQAEKLLLADVDFGASENQRRQWPFLRDRRIDLYTDLSRPYK